GLRSTPRAQPQRRDRPRGRLRDRSPDGPPSEQARANRARVNPETIGPLLRGQRFAAEREESVPLLVSVLLDDGFPSLFPRLVVAIVVDAPMRNLRPRSRPDVGEECREVVPPRADGDPAPAIAMIR